MNNFFNSMITEAQVSEVQTSLNSAGLSAGAAVIHGTRFSAELVRSCTGISAGILKLSADSLRYVNDAVEAYVVDPEGSANLFASVKSVGGNADS